MKSSRPKVYIITLGCKVNQCDGEELGRALARQGFPVESGIESEISAGVGTPALQFMSPIFVVNTCTVTSTADAKARKLIRRLVKDHPGAKIIVTGCYAVRNMAAVTELGDNILVVPNREKPRLADIITTSALSLKDQKNREASTPTLTLPHQGGGEKAPMAARDTSASQAPSAEFTNTLQARNGSISAKIEANCRAGAPSPAAVAKTTPQPISGRARAFVKVQDGCDHGCTYCIVPAVRGPMLSKPISEIVEEVTALCEADTKEVVLCGIRLGAYGADLQEDINLGRLLRALKEIPIPRLRLSSIEPLDVSEDLLAELTGHLSLCHHLHLPVQSGDDGVLAAMGRGYKLSDYRELVERIRRIWPDLSLTTDVMVGFPGESEAAFENTLEMIREFDFAKVHVFRYSPRPGTPAAAMKDQVPEQIKRARMEAVQELADELFQRRAERMLGEVVEVLIEQRNPASGRGEGLTPHYLRVEIASTEPLTEEIVRAKITGTGKDFLVGELAQEAPKPL